MIKEGSLVSWKRGKGVATAKVREIFDRPVTITSKGSKSNPEWYCSKQGPFYCSGKWN